MAELIAIGCYFSLLLLIVALTYKKNVQSADFIIGNRSLTSWRTALAAHASDMSSWLFMAYPAMIFTFGMSRAWIAIGLLGCMYLNWIWVAPKIRLKTEQYNNLTFFGYLENRFNDTSGWLRAATSSICVLFYTIYISSALVGLGLLIESLFGMSYTMAISITLLIAVPYVLIGGYRTLATIDLFQGLFLLAVIVFVPCFIAFKMGGFSQVLAKISASGLSLNLLPTLSLAEGLKALAVMLGWGLGYFGQPAILTKFMGIKKIDQMPRSRNIGMSWMALSLIAATAVALVGVAFFNGHLNNPEMVFIDLVKANFPPFLIGLILCAVFAATINVLSSQMLVVCSSITEDVYKRLFKKEANSRELVRLSRLGILAVSAVAFLIAYFKISSIYSLVLYAWSGLGAAFAPLLLFSLYSRRSNKAIAWSAIVAGAGASALWPYFNQSLKWPIDPIIVGFAAAFTAIGCVIFFSRSEVHVITEK